MEQHVAADEYLYDIISIIDEIKRCTNGQSRLANFELKPKDLDIILRIRKELLEMTTDYFNKLKVDPVTCRELLKMHYLGEYWQYHKALASLRDSFNFHMDATPNEIPKL